MDKTFCVICKIFHAPNEGCPVYVPMLTAVPQCPSCAALRARIEDVEGMGRIMHESWTRTKRAQGFHHQSECYAMDRYESNGPCPKCHSDLIPWEQLPEGQKDINRHAFDDVRDHLMGKEKG